MRIKSEDVKEVIRRFESVLPIANKNKDKSMRMNCYFVQDYDYGELVHKCGTVHCHAGWFTVATMIERGMVGDGNCYDVNDGIHEMANILGFPESLSLCEYIEESEEFRRVWGNQWAGDMFMGRIAFYDLEKRPYCAQNLQHIVDHWKEVYERVLEAENG